ncbi:MAG: antibiotic biosynthesis monooxygenase [Rhodospirillales bacterium]|nr:antibiotic biosynthesis monooxygenase [Rhodospirillales bacterium]
MIGVVATITVAEGNTAEFERKFIAQMAAVHANEPACHLYTLCRTDDANVFVVMERYDDMAGFEFHRDSAHMAKHRAGIGPLLAGPVDVKIMEEVE